MIQIISPEQFGKKERAGIPAEVLQRTMEVVENIQKNGFRAVSDYTAKFDGFDITKENARISEKEVEEACKELPEMQKKAIDEAFERVYTVQRKIAASALKETTADIGGGSVVFRPRPIERAGIYVPGGVAPLPSSLLMAGITARAAGVEEIIVCTPPRRDGLSPAILYAAKKLGITAIYQIGGAQAIAAMASGLPGLMKKVDIICGPGNVYAAAAKQIVSAKGLVKVDLVAGPSEVLIIADETAKVDYIAADMLAQAEHGVNSPAILLTCSKELAESAKSEIARQLKSLKNKELAEKSLANYGAIVLTESIEQAVEIANDYAPEHLELLTREPMISKIKNAGAIFVNTCESFADYGMSGGNHILPTGGTAKFLSGLSVYDFIVRTYVETMSDSEQESLAGLAAAFADIEGLEAHANAARLRGVKK